MLASEQEIHPIQLIRRSHVGPSPTGAIKRRGMKRPDQVSPIDHSSLLLTRFVQKQPNESVEKVSRSEAS